MATPKESKITKTLQNIKRYFALKGLPSELDHDMVMMFNKRKRHPNETQAFNTIKQTLLSEEGSEHEWGPIKAAIGTLEPFFAEYRLQSLTQYQQKIAQQSAQKNSSVATADSSLRSDTEVVQLFLDTHSRGCRSYWKGKKNISLEDIVNHATQQKKSLFGYSGKNTKIALSHLGVDLTKLKTANNKVQYVRGKLTEHINNLRDESGQKNRA